jgi:hypothetical protein
MIFIDLSYEFEITLSDTTQPVVCAGFSRREGGHVRILNNLIRGNNTHGPTRKTRGDTKVIVYAISKELPLAAANPISLVMALDSECLVEPSFALENADKLLEDIQRFFFLSIPKRCVSCFHIAPARSFKGFEDSRVQEYVIPMHFTRALSPSKNQIGRLHTSQSYASASSSLCRQLR